MRKFLLFMLGLIALFVLIANLGPMLLLGAGVWLLYIIFKKFIKTDSALQKIGWLILGLVLISITIANIYAVIGFAAAYALYVVYKKWNQAPHVLDEPNDDPFMNFEKQWASMKNN